MTERQLSQCVIVDPDVDDVSRAASFVDQLAPRGVSFKIGLEFIYTMILQTIFATTLKVAYNNLRAIIKLFKLSTHQIFFDTKLKDIPNTVGGVARIIVKMGVGMFNLHCDSGSKMMEEAAKSATEGGKPVPWYWG